MSEPQQPVDVVLLDLRMTRTEEFLKAYMGRVQDLERQVRQETPAVTPASEPIAALSARGEGSGAVPRYYLHPQRHQMMLADDSGGFPNAIDWCRATDVEALEEQIESLQRQLANLRDAVDTLSVPTPAELAPWQRAFRTIEGARQAMASHCRQIESLERDGIAFKEQLAQREALLQRVSAGYNSVTETLHPGIVEDIRESLQRGGEAGE